jgi:peptidoglycan/LPS O-acetylase OafA/YrhL
MLTYLFMVGNIFSVFHGWSANCMTHLWSISIEEQFYLIWPGLNKWFGKRGILICCAAGIVLANGTLFILGQRHADVFTTVWANTLVQFELFVTGILLAIWLKGNKPSLRMAGRLGVLAAVALSWFASVYYFKAFGIGHATSGLALMAGYALNSAGCAGLIYAILGMDVSKVSGVFIYLGKISYGLYVFHLLGLLCAKVLLWETHMPEFANVPRACLGLLFTVVLAMASYRWLELPFLRLKANYTWVPSRPA